jgi:hypothetical protein
MKTTRLRAKAHELVHVVRWLLSTPSPAANTVTIRRSPRHY